MFFGILLLLLIGLDKLYFSGDTVEKLNGYVQAEQYGTPKYGIKPARVQIEGKYTVDAWCSAAERFSTVTILKKKHSSIKSKFIYVCEE